jgi:mRNA interferase MazF
VLDVRALVTVAEISTSARGLAAEVEFDHEEVGLDRASVVNCDGLHTIAQSMLTNRVGEVSEPTLRQVCSAVSYALGC